MIDESRIHVMIQEEAIEMRVRELGQEISEDYAGEELVVVCILNGGVMFMTELAKNIQVPMTMDFMKVSSYGNEQVSSGVVKIKQDLSQDIKGKHVLIVEDIVDTGRTLYHLKQLLREREAASVKICSLLDKPQRRLSPVVIEYTGFVIEDKFVLGYGLDYEQYYRNLPYVAYVE